MKKKTFFLKRVFFVGDEGDAKENIIRKMLEKSSRKCEKNPFLVQKCEEKKSVRKRKIKNKTFS